MVALLRMRTLQHTDRRSARPHSCPRTLTAVLMNPPLSDGSRTRRHLAGAARALACSHVSIVNLFPLASENFRQLGEIGRDASVWLEHRDCIRERLRGVEVVLLGWGISRLPGVANVHLRAQV